MSKGNEKEKELRNEETVDKHNEQVPCEEAEVTPDDKLAELNDSYLRLMAEYDNFKKRTQKEKIEIYTSAAADVIEGLLPVIDAVQRAVEIDSDSEGIKLIKKQLDDVFGAIGVEEIKALGEQFDPELHNAVMHIDDEAIDNNTVVEEFAKGYKYKSRVIRHSMVKVAN